MIGLDVHMIVSASTQPEYVAQAIASVEEAQQRTSFPVQFHIVDGTPGHVGVGRYEGYSKGTHKYVTFVDDDDYVLPNAFNVLASALMYQPAATFTKEWLLQNGVMTKSNSRHHLAVYDRDVMQSFDFRDWKVDGDLMLKHKLMREEATIIDVPEHVYVWRVYMSKGRALRRQHTHEMREAYGQHS